MAWSGKGGAGIGQCVHSSLILRHHCCCCGKPVQKWLCATSATESAVGAWPRACASLPSPFTVKPSHSAFSSSMLAIKGLDADGMLTLTYPASHTTPPLPSFRNPSPHAHTCGRLTASCTERPEIRGASCKGAGLLTCHASHHAPSPCRACMLPFAAECSECAACAAAH